MFRPSNLQTPLQGLPDSSHILPPPHNAYHSASPGGRSDPSSFRGGPQIAGIDLVAMLVSDSGLASTEPVWWNTSPMGCFLLGLQPRGGWQVMQRTVQWGQDRVTKAFGVNCTKPLVYAFFTCNIRNRIEVWNSPRWVSPMQDVEGSPSWAQHERCTVSRPTKLIDGSRGGQAFICELLRPKDDEHYNIETQAKMQFLSVLLVAAGKMDDQSLTNFERALKEDFDITERLGSIFSWLKLYIALGNVVMILVLCGIAYHFLGRPFLGFGTSYVIEVSSIACWAVGAVGLLMQGGNPRVRLTEGTLPLHVQERYDELVHESRLSHLEQTPTTEQKSSIADTEKISTTVTEVLVPAEKQLIPGGQLKLRFGSVHGSVYLADKGYCCVSPELVIFICTRNLVLSRPWQWYCSVVWSALMLMVSIALQIVGTHTASTGSVVLGVIILLSTSVMRGSGISGPEEWQIPAWKRRKGTSFGAPLLGSLSAR